MAPLLVFCKRDTYLVCFIIELSCGGLELVDVLFQVLELRLHLPQLYRHINWLAFAFKLK